tara:strand:- start:552 stop:785 length:234 start_codon:yes stop_codon:yes gene_type:complete
MNLKFGMPELLVLFALFMYSQSFWFSVVSFCLGLLGRIIQYLMDYNSELKKAEAINQSVDELGTAFKDLFNVNKDKV